MKKRNEFALFIKDHGNYGFEAKVVKSPTDAEFAKITSDGYEFILDVFTDEETAYRYGEENLNAYRRPCCLCGQYVPTSHVQGQKWSVGDGRWYVLNGYICEQCLDSNEINVRHV